MLKPLPLRVNVSKPFKLSLFIFRRDLRLVDNTGLHEAMKVSECVVPCFIFDDRQLSNNPYFGEKAFSFLLQSLEDLADKIKQKGGQLFFLKGVAEDCVEKLLKMQPIEAIFFNDDYTPFSQKRDAAIKKIAEQNALSCFSFSDTLLNSPGKVLKKDGQPYTVFTPFYRYASQLPVLSPRRQPKFNFYRGALALHQDTLLKSYQAQFESSKIYKGGRDEALKLLNKLKKIKNYEAVRDFPEKNGTSHLSAHHKFGTISVRESFYATENETFRKELYWRDFFTHIAFHFPHVFKGAFHQKYNRLQWDNNKSHFKKWCEGKTGFPIVDAGMRELNETGYMHNRVRMIVASFLVKDLGIDWRWGERFFAQKLIDYDPAVNNGNWQWAASTGCDAQPYFRIFNPTLQQKRFDPQLVYIHKWLSALDTQDYPAPMVDHKVAAAKAKNRFQ